MLHHVSGPQFLGLSLVHAKGRCGGVLVCTLRDRDSNFFPWVATAASTKSKRLSRRSDAASSSSAVISRLSGPVKLAALTTASLQSSAVIVRVPLWMQFPPFDWNAMWNVRWGMALNV